MSKLFINRPIFAIVIAIIITLLGMVAITSLPIARYPNITPPQVQVRATYTGASAEVISTTVASVIEQQIMGVQDMDYMVSTSSNSGSYSLTVQYNQGTDPDMDTVNTQNRVARAEPSLPTSVRTLGVTTTKSAGGMDFIFALSSPNETYDMTFLKNYGTNFMLDAIKSVNGVGTVTEFGADYAMRLWLNPQKMYTYGVTMTDVTNAISAQNIQAAAGAIGATPIPSEQQFQYSVNVKGRLITPEEFGNIVVKKDSNNNLLRIKDIATIQMGANNYGFNTETFGKPVAGFAISLTTDANALQTIGAVKALIEEQSKSFPSDMTYKVVVDNTEFVTASIEEVLQTFFEALLIVSIIVFIFLGSWRSTIIPMIAVPVSLLGTFASFVVLGFTINTLTLFAMVLAIGLVVDDAIVVIEAVEFEMQVNRLKPKEATLVAMQNVQAPVIGVAFVLASVFVPVSFMGGMTGILYKQFALTIAVSVMISAFVALSLTPALCATMLRPHVHREIGTGNLLDKFLDKFNMYVDRFTEWYGFALVKLSRNLKYTVIALVGFVVVAGGVFRVMPTAFVPDEDSGYFIVSVNLPPGATLSRTIAVVGKIQSFFEANKSVENVMGVSGFDILSSAQKPSGGVLFAKLTPWSERKSPSQSVKAQIGQTFGFAGQSIPEATVLALNPPAIPGLGNTGGITMYLLNKSGDSVDNMIAVANQYIAAANKNPNLSQVYTTFNNGTPAYNFDINRDKAAKDGVSISDIFTALQGFYGSIQVNDFTQYGKNYKVIVQAAPEYRTSTDMNKFIYIANSAGTLVSIDNYIIPKQSGVADIITRFDNYPAIKISANTAAGVSSGQAIAALKEVALTLPEGYSYDWADQAREEVKAGTQTTLILGMGLIFVFLVLAALYESWKVPFSVLLSVPSGLVGAAVVPYLFNLQNDIYVQIGLLTLIGLAAKNAILIVEYAKVRVDNGMRVVDASIEAAKIRLRPIVMTSLAFILGCVPLAISTGAGAGARVSMGVTVVAGMTTATLFGIFVIPMLFIIIESVGFGKKNNKH